jgi:hypothetical protein
MPDFLKTAWDGLVNFAVGTVKLIGKGLKAVADAIGLSSLPLHVIRGDASLAHASKAAATHVVSQATLIKTGAVTKAAAAKVETVAVKCGLAKVAALCAKITAASSVAVGTTVVAAGLCILFVGAVWFVKRLVKKATEFIETLSAVEDTEETVEGLALVA